MTTTFTFIRYCLSILMTCGILLTSNLSFAGNNDNVELTPNSSNFHTNANSNNDSRALWDVLVSYNVADSTFPSGWAGTNYMFGEFWASVWSTDTMARFNQNGSLINIFTVPGLSGTRSFTTDSVYVYAANTSATIYRINHQTQQLAPPHIVTSGLTVRHCTYDATLDNNNGGFWVGTWDTDLTAVNMAGATISSIPAATHGLTGMYGSAIDVTSGGSSIWIFNQGGTNGAELVQLSTSTGATITVRDVFLDLNPLFSFPQAGLAGGAFMSADLVPGKVVLGGMLQNAPDVIFGYEYDASALPCVSITNATVMDALCFGGSDGSIALSVNGGTAPYTYNWSNGGSNAMISNLAPGTYTVSITDVNNCPETISDFTVSSPSAVNALLSFTNESCPGCNDGTASANGVGGVSPYTYTWSTTPPSSGGSVSNLAGGMYTLTVTDNNGCEETIDFTVQTLTSIFEPSNEIDLNVFEVGNSNLFKLDINMSISDYISVNVYDITGNLVLKDDIGFARSTLATLDLNMLDSGVYLLEVNNSEGRTIRKIIR
ncbi:MAG: T9SS type A sorting domain-containing protein [Chitinophagales bacterium]|nr:T9SS type A sorting domain-containing protein [Chitinophagales bacterium]